MKKLLCALLSCTLLLGLAACTSAPTGGVENPSQPDASAASDLAAEFEKKSQTYLNQFQQGQFDEFYENTAEEFSSQVPKETFAQQWAAILQMAGAQEEVNEVESHDQDGAIGVKITATHVLRQLISTFSYNAEGKVIGTFVSYQPLAVEPQSSDQWEEVEIQVGSDEKKLNGLLTLPKVVESPPVVILVQGSGPSNMDEKIGTGGNKPFADLAHGLAEQGIASIRYDKRTYSYPADAANRGVEFEYLDDVKAAVQLAAGDGRVDGEKIYLLGHSEGGMLAPKFAEDSPEIKGIISMAGSLRKLEDISLDQVRAALAKDTTMTGEQKQAYLAQVEAETQKVKQLDPSDTTSVIQGVPAVYWNSLNAIDGKAIVSRLQIPMLILQGEEDFQVSIEKDYQLWKDTLAGRQNVTFHLYPGLNHLMMKGGTRDSVDVTVYNTPAQVDPQVITDIAAWIASL